MRHVILMCKNHPDLRWSCKEIAFTDKHGYNNSRNLFFIGKGPWKFYEDFSGIEPIDFHNKFAQECDCPPSFLIRAPEDSQIKQ